MLQIKALPGIHILPLVCKPWLNPNMGNPVLHLFDQKCIFVTWAISKQFNLHVAMYSEHFLELSSWEEADHRARAWLSHREPNIVHVEELCASRRQNHQNFHLRQNQQNLVRLVGEGLRLPAGKTRWLVAGELKSPAWKTRPFCPQPRSFFLLCEPLGSPQGWCTKSQVCSLCRVDMLNILHRANTETRVCEICDILQRLPIELSCGTK